VPSSKNSSIRLTTDFWSKELWRIADNGIIYSECRKERLPTKTPTLSKTILEKIKEKFLDYKKREKSSLAGLSYKKYYKESFIIK
jgi:hypothetical protein